MTWSDDLWRFACGDVSIVPARLCPLDPRSTFVWPWNTFLSTLQHAYFRPLRQFLDFLGKYRAFVWPHLNSSTWYDVPIISTVKLILYCTSRARDRAFWDSIDICRSGILTNIDRFLNRNQVWSHEGSNSFLKKVTHFGQNSCPGKSDPYDTDGGKK